MHYDSTTTNSQPPLDYAPNDSPFTDDTPPPARISRMATAAWFVAAFIVGMFTGLAF